VRRTWAESDLLQTQTRFQFSRSTASAYLYLWGVSGEVSATTEEVTVSVRRVVPMSILGLFGAGSRMVSAQRSARAVTGP
jgi:hypothetical protein